MMPDLGNIIYAFDNNKTGYRKIDQLWFYNHLIQAAGYVIFSLIITLLDNMIVPFIQYILSKKQNQIQ